MALVIARMCASVNVLSSARAAMPARAERDALKRVGRIGPVRVIRLLERGDIDQHTRRGQLTRQGMNRHQKYPHRPSWFTISTRCAAIRPDTASRSRSRSAYCEIVRSLENLPGMADILDRPARPGIGFW